jgi:hypothetical protein
LWHPNCNCLETFVAIHLVMIVWCFQKNLVTNFFWGVLCAMNKVPKWKFHKWKNSQPKHIKNIYKSYKVQCSYPLKTTLDMCFEKLCLWNPHYLTTIRLMQLMCNYATYVLWKYKALKIKYHIWNLWSSIIIVYTVGIGSIYFFDKCHLNLFANCAKVF